MRKSTWGRRWCCHSRFYMDDGAVFPSRISREPTPRLVLADTLRVAIPPTYLYDGLIISSYQKPRILKAFIFKLSNLGGRA